MKTLKELNERFWYRLIKVVYVLLYLPYIFLLLFGLYSFGRDYHPTVYPNALKEALNDPEFYKVTDYDKRQVLNELNEDFRNLPYDEQTRVIEAINKRPIPKKEIVQEALEKRGEKYIYASYYTWNIKNSILYILILTVSYFLLMEIIKRTFYYVVIGKFVPKE